jgi:hypothetical protein
VNAPAASASAAPFTADRRAGLHALAAALRGEAPAEQQWLDVLWLANTGLVTPRLRAALARSGGLDQTPAEVRGFLDEVETRNFERNRRLFAQLNDAVAALNAAGIEPTVLKGAAIWSTLGRPAAFDRMLNDLDLLVRPTEAQRAVEVLETAGFPVHSRYPGPEVHVVAELGRPTDVGFIDLHQRPPGPPGVVEMAGLHRHSRRVEHDGIAYRVPCPAMQVFLLVLHDQFHDGDYWRGGVDLRHLLDIADLAAGPDGVDWDLVRTLCRTSLVRHAMEAQLAAAGALVGAAVPRPTAWGRLQHRRRLAQYHWPAAAQPLAFAAMALEAPFLMAHRLADRADRRRLFGKARAAVPVGERVERLRHIFAGVAAGKI